jgi:hypothetical protein
MNPIAKMALSQLIKFMKEKDIAELKVFIDSNNEIDFIPVSNPDKFILQSELTKKVEFYENKILEMKNYLKQLQS